MGKAARNRRVRAAALFSKPKARRARNEANVARRNRTTISPKPIIPRELPPWATTGPWR